MKLLFHGKRHEVDTIYTFQFQPVEPLSSIAGQSIKIALDIGDDTAERRFTISSAPYEQTIDITTHVSDSNFKQALTALESGAIINAYGIDGRFTWPTSSARPLFCASGLGITPYFSMLKQRLYERQPLSATLLYASRTDNLIFQHELENLSKHDDSLKVIFFPSQQLTGDIIRAHQGTQGDYQVYISGSSTMVDRVGDDLLAGGLPEHLLKRDWFIGRPGLDLWYD